MFATRYKGSQVRSKPKWTGPYRINKVNSEWDFDIEHLVTKKIVSAHSTRLSFYADSSMDVELDLKYQIVHDEAQLTYQVEKILAHKQVADNWLLLIQWKGFDKEDSTWEPAGVIAEDVPVIVAQYLRTVKNAPQKASLEIATSFRGRR